MTPMTLLAEAPVLRLGQTVKYEPDYQDYQQNNHKAQECRTQVEAHIPDWLRCCWEKSQAGACLQRGCSLSRSGSSLSTA
jgi:GTP pyrophosphokinase